MKKFQKGLTLIELMIGLSLGLFVIAGIITTMLGSLQSSYRTEIYRNLDEKGKYTIELLQPYIEHAGFAGPGIMPPIDANGQPAIRKVNLATNLNLEGGGINPDTLSLIANQMQVNFNCSGAAVAARTNAMVTEFAIIPAAAGLPSALGCRSSISPVTNIISPAAGTPFIRLIDGVENLQVLYLLKTSAGNYQYVNAAGLNNNNVYQVIAIKIALLINGAPNILDATNNPIHGNDIFRGDQINTNNRYTLLDAPAITPNDNRPRQIFETTIQLKASGY